jgi:hypothetical protein
LLSSAQAASQSSASCSAAYYAALGELRDAKGEDVANAMTALRVADPVLPGRWIYSRALFPKAGKAAPKPVEVERACIDKVKVAGRVRCAKYADPQAALVAEVPAELTISPAPTSDELRLLKAVADLVDGRGAIPDVGNNGRHMWVTQRAANDLKLYITQPAHPALCSGGREITDFYGNALKPLQKRIEDVGDLVKRTRLLAAVRVTAALPAPVDGAKLPQAATIAGLPLVEMTVDAVRGVISAEAAQAVLAEQSTLAALMRAKPALIVAQVAADKAEDQVLRERILAAGRAVRMIEAAAYTEIYAARYAKFSSTVMVLPREIQIAHSKACTCGN